LQVIGKKVMMALIKTLLAVTVMLASLVGAGQSAEMVEVAPGVFVSKKVYPAQSNEQPFFGFIHKTPELRDADAKFAAGAISAMGNKDKAADEILARGWSALSAGDNVTAGRRFNQAYLVDPGRSGVYHSFAALVHSRFHDADYAEELFRIAKTRPNPMPTLNADFGRLLLIAKRAQEAQPLLEQAVKDTPEFADAWSNLAFARYYNGDRGGACVAATEASRRSNTPAIQADLAVLKTTAKCN
jgi:predicted Zn-dependent protease